MRCRYHPAFVNDGPATELAGYTVEAFLRGEIRPTCHGTSSMSAAVPPMTRDGPSKAAAGAIRPPNGAQNSAKLAAINRLDGIAIYLRLIQHELFRIHGLKFTHVHRQLIGRPATHSWCSAVTVVAACPPPLHRVRRKGLASLEYLAERLW